MNEGHGVGSGRRVLRMCAALAVSVVTFLPGPAAAVESSLSPVEGHEALIRLSPGDRGFSVVRMQSLLQDAGFYRGPITGEYDTPTAEAVVTFHKYLDIDRTSTFNALDWIRIKTMPEPDIPYRWEEPDRVEIDTTRQLLFVIRDRQIAGILPTSTGSGHSYYSVRQGATVRSGTPHGDFELYWRQWGWNCDSTTGWCVYNYWGFTQFYGIHGYGNVPAYPASHGCARVHVWDSDWLDNWLFIGMPVHVWRESPADTPPPPEYPSRYQLGV